MQEIATQLTELHPVYALIRDLPEEFRGDAGKVADVVVAQQFRTPSSLGPGNGMRCLRLALEAADPDRKCAQFILDGFGGWCASLAPNGRDAFFEEFPTLAPAAADLGEAGMKRVIDCTNRDPRRLACIAAYSMTTKEAVVAMAGLASVHSTADLQRFTAAFPAERMEENRDAERLPEALARVPEALPLACRLVEHDASAAYGTLKRLRGVERPPGYLEAFERIVETIGIQACGWCLDTLPGLFKKLGAVRAGAAVNQAVEVARRFGAEAGQAFLEGRIAAAKELLG
ncbi:MAG: hypothetical protein R2729_29595 [Bryobacteraceae bacterium]